MGLPNPTASATDTRPIEPSRGSPQKPILVEFANAARGVKRRGDEFNTNNKASTNRANIVISNAGKEVINTEVGIDAGSGFDESRKARLIQAIIEGNTLEVLTVLEEKASLASCVDDEGRSLLYLACLYDRLSIVRFLRGFEVDMNQADERGITPLHAACMKSKNPDLLHFLVRQGASIHSVTSSGGTILHDAAMAGNVTGIVFALARGIHVDVRTDIGLDTGLTPLAYAFSFCKDKRVFKTLINAGADVGFVDPDGCTLLHFAVLHNNLVAAKFGLMHGLKVGIYNNDGENCLAVARGAGAELWDLLKIAGRQELLDCSFCDGKAHMQFKPCLHRVSCDSCCSGWSKCVCGAVIEEKSDVMEDPLAFDEALKNKGCFVRELVQNVGRLQEEIGLQKEEIGRQEEELGRQEEEIWRKVGKIERQKEEIERQEEEIGLQKKEIGQHKRQIGHQKREIGRQKVEIRRQKGVIGRQKGSIGGLKEEISRQEIESERKEVEIWRHKEEIVTLKESQKVAVARFGERIIGLKAKEKEETQRAKAMEASLKQSVGDLEREKRELIEDKTCAICLDAPKDIIFASCGHSACSHCQTGLQVCHVCRARIGNRIRFF